LWYTARTCSDQGKVLDCTRTFDSATLPGKTVRHAFSGRLELVVKLWHLSLNVVIPGFRAFSCTGVDYFGPILAKLSLDSLIEGALSERCTATEVPTSYSPKELREEPAVGINPRFTSRYVRKAWSGTFPPLAVQWGSVGDSR